jgi:hypothetical protein
MNQGQECLARFLVARGDTAEVFKFVKEALDFLA